MERKRTYIKYLKANDIVVEITDNDIFYISRIYENQNNWLKSYIDFQCHEFYYYSQPTATLSHDSTIYYATEEQKYWLEYCELHGEYRSKEEALENYYVKQFIQQYLQ